jgi:phage host-nuclease inhibitor protein Gam
MKKKSRRTASKGGLTINNLDQADSALDELREVNEEIRSIEDDANEKIAKLQQKQTTDTEGLYGRKIELESKLETFSRRHYERGGFGDKKSLELPAGFVGFRRKSNTRITADSEEQVIESFQKAAKGRTRKARQIRESMDELFSVRVRPVKSAIKKLDLSDEELRELGVEVDVNDMAFAYSTDKTKPFGSAIAKEARAAR